MHEKPLYCAFDLKSPWNGTFCFFIRGVHFYREALDEFASLIQTEKIKQIERRVYDMAYREACAQAENS